jgi:hypothetical protein
VRPGRERLAHPQVKFVFGQPLLNERRLEQLDHLIAVGVGRAKVTPALRRCRLISRP